MGNFFEAFKKGKELFNSATWKNRSTLAGALATVMIFTVGLLRAFGVDLYITNELVNILAGGISAIVFVFMQVINVTTSKKVGLPGDEK